ncbi:hypothetical protein Tco_0863331 [Tanacetum coccineum]
MDQAYCCRGDLGGGWPTKVTMRWFRKEMSKYLRDFQFGVGVPNGAEAVLHGANRFLNKFHSDGSLAMLTVDFSNAFNLVDQNTLLHEGRGGPAGLELNIKKTEVFWPSCNGVKVKEGLFPRDIGRPTLGVKLLGGAVSRDAGFISSLACGNGHRVLSELMSFFPGEAVSIFDNGLRRAIEAIVVCGGPFFGDFQWRLASPLIRFGGLGLCSAEDVSTFAFVASEGAYTWSLIGHTSSGFSGIDWWPVSDFGGPRELSDRSHSKGGLPYGQIVYTCVWVGWGKHACVDLTGVSPLVGLRDNGFVAGQAALKDGRNTSKC